MSDSPTPPQSPDDSEEPESRKTRDTSAETEDSGGASPAPEATESTATTEHTEAADTPAVTEPAAAEEPAESAPGTTPAPAARDYGSPDPARRGRHRRRSDDPEATTIIGVEDVLAGANSPSEVSPNRHVQDKPARRSPWNRPRDRIIAVAMALVAVAAAVVVWANGESRATISETAEPGPPLPDAPVAVPPSLTELWQAPSGATRIPIAQGRTVVTASGGEIDGRDPLTGQVRWRYSRDIPLCTATKAWSRAVALYREDGVNGESGCGEAIGLDADTGHREAQRTGNAPLGTGLLFDGSYLTAFGPTLLNTWRDDLVETVEYGKVPALVNPDKQPRVNCTYGSIAAASGRIGVVERCPGDPGDRITVYRSSPKESDEPQVSFSEILPGHRGRMVAMSGDYTAIAMPEGKQLVLYDGDGSEISAYPIDLPDGDLANDPAGGVPATSSTSEGIYWFTGSKLMALNRDSLAPKWTLSTALGPGVLFDHQFVVPIPGGLAVLNENDGSTIRTIGVDRHGYTGPVRLSTVGPVLLEQRGDTVTALR